ncbi:DUF58 domain-containing protein [Bifidobacterium choerinum]|uniref:DUF58 domain-containing protein n=1 Tax=Bifidobacterium choerinum TaxID=35760 RepID=A0A087AE52_9BIFI|nr:DUF58 domain-containing protein [Bifidobacterium choerinum]KFI57052.1 hypothetical protein BCHO_0726 [Bifidobacterium choerinum]
MTDSALRARARKRAFIRGWSRFTRRVRHLVTAYVSPLGWTALALAVAGLVLYLTLGYVEMLALCLVLVTMLLAALVLSIGNTSFDATIEVSDRRVSVGDEVKVQVDIANPGTTPTASARADLPLGDEHERFPIPLLAPHQSKHTTVTFRAISRSVLPVGPLTIRKGDPFGLMRHEHELADHFNVYIHPDIVMLDSLHAGIPRDLEGNPSGDIVDDDLDFYGLREYEPGDDVRHVHWLSSARTRTLMLRQYEATRRTDTSVTLDVNPDDYLSKDEFELAVSVHASIGVQALLEDRPLYTHVARTNLNPRNPMELLDACSAIEPDFRDRRNLAQEALAATPDASFYCFTVGHAKPLADIRRMMMALPPSATCLVLQTSPTEPRTLRRFPDFTLATVNTLDDLPQIMGALR